MNNPVPLVEIWRDPFLESLHHGHAVVCDLNGNIVDAWGDPDAVVLPRSSSKMIQALPLVESGAADRAGLDPRHLALACASHNGAPLHVDLVNAWIGELGLDDDAFRCGPQVSRDKALREKMICSGESPCQVHNNCSGKHAGFLTLAKDMGAGPEYIDIDHPVQVACLEAFEDVTGQTSPGFGIDGCSAPNFGTQLSAMARAMAFFATAHGRDDARSKAAARLVDAMREHPELVAGKGRACTELMRATDGRVALKTGAEAFFVAIVPEKGLGVALKIMDGGTRAAECAIAAILVRLGVLDSEHPSTLRRMNAPMVNRRKIETGMIRPVSSLL